MNWSNKGCATIPEMFFSYRVKLFWCLLVICGMSFTPARFEFTCLLVMLFWKLKSGRMNRTPLLEKIMAEKIVSRYFLGTFLASLSIIGFIQTMHVSLAYAEAETHLSPMGEEVRKQEAINEQLKKVGRLEIYGTPGPGRVLTMPNSPANLFVDVQSQKVRLTWSLVKDSVAYIVYVSLDGNNFKRLTHKPIKGSVYTAENLENDRMYYFAVESVSKWGKRSNKKIVSVSPQNDPIHGGRP